MKKIGGLILCLFFSIIYACADKSRSAAEQTALEFLTALKQQDLVKMGELYPSVINIEIFYASDTSYIQSLEPISGKAYKVNVISRYLNDNGGMETRKVILMIYPANSESRYNYLIKDSYGLCSWENYPYYHFAVHTGCVASPALMSDQQSVVQMKIAKQLLFYLAKEMYKDLSANIRIVSSTITEQNSTQAKGKAVVENRSDYSMPDLKYVIIYYDSNDRKIGSDKGWITQTTFESGQTIVFDFITNFNTATANASFQVDFDLELILKFVMDDDIYTGKEYKEFVSKKMVEI